MADSIISTTSARSSGADLKCPEHILLSLPRQIPPNSFKNNHKQMNLIILGECSQELRKTLKTEMPVEEADRRVKAVANLIDLLVELEQAQLIDQVLDE